MQRNGSLKRGDICTTPSTHNNNNEKHNVPSPENVLRQVQEHGQKGQVDGNNVNTEDGDDKEEVKISGCRRRIQNRPTKKNNEQRKFRSHSPLPLRKQKQNIELQKSKVLYILVSLKRMCNNSHIYNIYTLNVQVIF